LSIAELQIHGLPIGDCRFGLRIADCIDDCGLPIALAIADWIADWIDD
jgi:hypothetical protein